MPVSISRLESVTHTLALIGVSYLWGGKAHPLSCPLQDIEALDCSGFAQKALYDAAWDHNNAPIRLPEGTAWDQRDFLLQLLPNPKDGSRLVLREHPGEVYPAACMNLQALLACFIRPVEGVHAGHVFFVWEGWTMESYGGHGVGRRIWNTPVLRREVNSILVLEHTT